MKLFRPTMTVSVEMGIDLAIDKGVKLVDRCRHTLFLCMHMHAAAFENRGMNTFNYKLEATKCSLRTLTDGSGG
jgi:hypothetical protein